MTKKIFFNILSSCFVVIIATIVIIFGVTYDYHCNSLMKELHAELNYVSAGVEESGINYLEHLKVNEENRITLIDFDGNVLYDTNADASAMENHNERKEIIEAIQNGEGNDIRISSTLSEKTMYCAKLLSDNKIIRVSTNQFTLWILLIAMIKPLLIVFIIALVLSYIAAHFSSKNVITPINKLDLDKIDDVQTYEEIEPLIQKIRTQNAVINQQIDELKRTQNEFNTITDNMNEGLLIVDTQGKILSYNKSAAKLLAISKSAENKLIDDLDVSQPFAGYIRAALLGEHVTEIVECNKKYLDLFCNPVFADGRVQGVITVILDVTEKYKRENFRREFSANVSHELKTPLAAILASAEIIGMKQTPKETDLHFAKNIVKETSRLINLVNDIIKLSKLDSSSAESNREVVDIYQIAKDITYSLAPIANKSKVSLKLFGEKTEMRCEPAIIDEIIFNLVDNAIKYNKENGRVTVTIAPKNGKPTIIVEDTGIGVSAENKDRIFERFYRVDKSRSKEIGGTGLGLSIVKHGIEYHNGTLHIDSVLGQGTKITVTF